MTAVEFVRMAAERGGWSLSRLAAASGVTRHAMNSTVNRDVDMRAGKLAALADLLGWELACVPKGSRLPAGAVRIDPMLPRDVRARNAAAREGGE